MPNKMLIDATHPEETRVVVLRGNRVEEFDFESASRRQLRGNIYLAKVTRVEPSLQAAFIDYGGNRHGFLAFSEIHPDYYQIPVADRQLLIDEEERAHRAADAEADRRAAARTAGRSVPASRGGSQRRQSSVASAPVVEAEQPHDSDQEHHEDAATPGDQQPYGEIREFEQDLVVDIVSDEANSRGEDAAGDEPPFVEDEGPAEDAVRTSFGVPVPLHTQLGADLDEMLGVGREEQTLPAEDTADADAETAGPDGDATDEDEIVAAASDENAADAGEDSGEDEASVTRARLPDEGSDDDEDDDEDDDDEDDDEEEAAEAEEGVEMVGGADALDEAQERTPRVRRQYKIQEVIKRRQIMLVQVVKEERGTKGAALTTYLSLAGRYSVLMPNTARGGGISRKITNPQDRNRLKEIAQDLEVPEGMGVILRTAGAARTKTEIKRDFEYLLRMWEQVRDMTLKSTAPTLVYEEGSVVKRAIRDLYSKDIDEVLVAGDAAFREAKDFMRMLMPSHAKNVKPYNENLPLLTRFGVESQLDAMFSPIVQLRSGGYIVLNQTEALVAIDVNSGRATREHHIEDTAFKTNLEAAEEISRQLRLRDLAGLIVIDFIDMDEKRNNRAVERKLKDCLKSDRARIQVGRISHFGLLEMSRQRLRTSVFESSTEKCPHCGGTGHMRSVSSVSLQCLRMLEETLLRGATHNIVVRTAAGIALYMLNQKRGHLRDLEQRFQITVSIRVDESQVGPHPFSIEKGEQVHSLEQARSLASQPPTVLAPPAVPDEDEFIEAEAEMDAEEGAASREDEFAEDGERGDGGENGGRRRRRRRRRGGRRTEDRSEDAAAEMAADNGEADDADGAEAGVADEELVAAAAGGAETAEADDAAEGESAEQRRRRRRGRRGGRRNRRSEGEAGSASAAAAEDGELGEIGETDATGEVGLDAEPGEPRFSFIETEDESVDAKAGDGGIIVSGPDQETPDDASDQSTPAVVDDAPDFLPFRSRRAPVEPIVDAADADIEPDLAEETPPAVEASPSVAAPVGGAESEYVAPAEREETAAAESDNIIATESEDIIATSSAVTEEASAQPDGPEAPEAPPRRRSTVREPVDFSLSRGLKASVVAAEQPESPIEPAESSALPEAAEPAAPPRTGWWARRVIGK